MQTFQFKIVGSFTAAVEMASEILGCHMFECYENVMADHVRRHDQYGTDKFFVSDRGKIFFVFCHEGQRVLNYTDGPSGACLSQGHLGVAKIDGDSIGVILTHAVDKADRYSRKGLMKELDERFVLADRETMMAMGATV